MQLTNTDYFFIVISLIIGVGFMLFGVEKLHRFYFGLILGFFFFVIINLHIKLLAATGNDTSFLVTNKGFILSFLSVFVVILGILLISTDYISFKVNNNLFGAFAFGCLIPSFFILLLAYIKEISFIDIGYLSDFFNYVNDFSYVITYLHDNPYLCIYLIAFLLFFRLLFRIIIGITSYIVEEIKKARAEDEEDSEE